MTPSEYMEKKSINMEEQVEYLQKDNKIRKRRMI